MLSFCKLLGVEKWPKYYSDLDRPQSTSTRSQSTSVDLDSNRIKTGVNLGCGPSNQYIRKARVAAILMV